MSGIVAIVWTDDGPADQATLENLTARMAYRGPHRQRTWSDHLAGLGHAFLRLDDKENSEVQPLTLDRQAWITADARIDDRDKLTKSLRRHGSQATPETSDAALIAEAYRFFGPDCPQHLLGDFAFAIWDQPVRRLTAAVDRFAIRPLYYAWFGSTFGVGSCLESLRLHPSFQAELDESALGDFLAFGHYRDASATIFAGIRRLPPAHVLIFEGGRLTIRRYWSPTTASVTLPSDGRQLVEQFKGILDAAVADRRVERHTALLLSGGLDSAVIAVSACGKNRPDSPTELRAHTVIYEHLIPDDEKSFAAQTAQAIGMPISFFAADEFEIFDWIGRLSWAPPEPLELPGLGLSIDFHKRLIADGPIVLTGNDGDTLFKASIPAHFRTLLRAGRFGRLLRDAAWYTNRRRRLALSSWYRRWRNRRKSTGIPLFPSWLRPEWVQRIGLDERWRDACNRSTLGGPRARVPIALSSSFYARVFDPFDSAWTGLPLEFRHPFMDLRIVEFLLSLPALPWCLDKELLRRALGGSVPESVRLRAKTPLQADPLVPQLFKRQESWLTAPTLHSDLEQFIDRSKLPVPANGHSSDEIWALLRPISLDFWWRQRIL